MGFFYIIVRCGAQAWDYSGIDLALVDLIGKGYVVDHCVSLYNRQEKEDAFREYLTTVINTLNKNFASYFGGEVLRMRYYDIINPKEEDNRTGDEIAAEIILKAGLRF